MKIFPDIAKESAENLRGFGPVSAIVENSGTYTITSSVSVEKIKLNGVVNFTDMPDFPDNYRIITIDYNVNTFEFTATTGKDTLVFGTWQGQSPYYDFGTWHELIKKITTKNLKTINQYRKYPLIYMLKEYDTDKVNERIVAVNNIKIYLINRTDLNTYSSEKIEETMPTLRTLADEYLNEMNMNSNVVGDIVEKLRELPFWEKFLKTDEPTEMIEISINKAQMDTKEYNCN